jgi:DMSO/TMAO reductase YedYZ molybdopterin-dependent catalytic subunit
MGAVGCAAYTGVRLKDVLESAGVRRTAVYVAYYGEDPHLSGDAKAIPISRGVPLEKAMDESTLLAWDMNGEPLPAQHGFPLRMVAPGWPASVSGKWLTRLWVRDRVHDGEKMGGHSYRVPRHPVAPGADVPDADMEIIGAMPVKSIVTRPATGVEHRVSDPLSVRGHAWCGDGPVRSVHLSIDFGSTWIETSLAPPANPFAWQHFTADLRFPTPGHFEVWARAMDHKGRQQPMVVPGWNPGGYLNNAMHRIAVRVVAA